ncbi:MAG TPA: carboxypeptidase-like regulatory domain-containing protein, partial [Candidatus Aquilonibacter sp.]|nr:carboxypeptidase-like regulatory domain-containing protein [Candidatus Aquilonibacter sp.]
MNLTHVWRRGLSGVRFAIAFATAAAFAATTLPASAGTTGVLNGTVVDASSGAPIASASVTASAPTGTFRTTTNDRGVYVFPGIYPDTYTVSVTAKGRQPQTEPGVTVFADQTATINFKLGTELRTIAKVTAHSPGGAFQPTQTTDTYTVTSKQAQDLIGNNLNISETTLITSLPGASLDSSGYPVIRGGRENEESFQFEGIPYTDAFTNQFTNALALPGAGLQSAQLTPGLGSADQASLGTGSLNLVVKRGSAPGYANFTMSAGGPGFDHRLNFEYGWATPGGGDSLYAAFAGQNSNPNYGHGASALSIGQYYGTRQESDREGLFNFVHRFGKNNNQSLQLFGDFAEHDFYIGYGGVSQCYKTCDPFYVPTATFYANLLPQLFGGPNPGLTPSDVRALTPLNPYQSSPTQTLAASGQAPYTYYEPNQAWKVEYTNNLNSSTYVTGMYYHVNSVTTFDFPYASGSSFYPDFLALQGGFQDGIKLNLTKEFSEKNLLKVGFNYAFLRPVYDQQEYTYGFLQTIPGLFGNSGNAEYADFIPGGIVSNAVNGGTATVRMPYSYEPSDTVRQLFGFGINDTITPNDKWKIDLGLRVDGTNDKIGHGVGVDPNTCFFYYQPVDQGVPAGGVRSPGNCGSPTFNVGNAQLQPRVLEPTIAVNYRLGRNDSLRASYGRSTEFLPLGGIDHWGGAAYYAGLPYANLSTAGSYAGVNLYGGAVTNCGLLHDTVCPNYGSMLYWDNQSALGVPFQPVKPETFVNADISWSHQFTKGILRGTEFKLTPWYRKGYDVFAATQSPVIVNGKPLTSPSGAVVFNPPVQSNQG